MKFLVPAVLTLAISMSNLPAAFAEFHRGDIIVSGITNFSTCGCLPPPPVPRIREFTPQGLLVGELLPNGFPFDVDFNSAGILFAAGHSVVYRFATDGTQLTPLSGAGSAESLSFARSGDLFAVGAGSVVKFAADGSRQWASSLGSGSVWGDLDSDQCTLYFLTGSQFVNTVGRFDVCTRTLLSPLPGIFPSFGGAKLLVLADGTLLASVASMYRIGRDGTVLRQYGTRATAYARDIDPNFVWVVTPLDRVAKFDLRDDTLASVPFDPAPLGDLMLITGIAIVGADAQAVPAASPLLLTLLALVLASFAIMRIRTG